MSILGNYKKLGTDRQGIEIYTSRPDVFVADYIFLTTINSICRWVVTSNFTGYQSLDCGSLQLLTSELEVASQHVLAMGQEAVIADNRALYLKLVREGRKVTPAAWSKGAFAICDLSATTFRVPDMRDTFPRFYGATRASGTYQSDAMRNLVGDVGQAPNVGMMLDSATPTGVFKKGIRRTDRVGSTMVGTGGPELSFDASNALPAGATTDPVTGEFRPINTAFVPVLHK